MQIYSLLMCLFSHLFIFIRYLTLCFLSLLYLCGIIALYPPHGASVLFSPVCTCHWTMPYSASQTVNCNLKRHSPKNQIILRSCVMYRSSNRKDESNKSGRDLFSISFVMVCYFLLCKTSGNAELQGGITDNSMTLLRVALIHQATSLLSCMMHPIIKNWGLW